MDNFMIGQRVIYHNVICVVCNPSEGYEGAKKGTVWIDNPEKRYKHWASIDNLKPLPGGQL